MSEHTIEPTPAFADLRKAPGAFTHMLQVVSTECMHIAQAKGFTLDVPSELDIAHALLEQTEYVIPKDADEMTVLLEMAARVARETAGSPESEQIALQHSELTEVLEAVRHGNPESDKLPGFSGAEEEYADVIIRVLQHGQRMKYRIAEAILAKIEVNRARPPKHGGKKF